MPEPPPDRSTARNVYVFGATSFLNDTASEMAYWVVPAFLLAIGGNAAQLGLIEGVAESVASLAKLWSGYLSDRVRHRKPLVIFGYALANAVKPLLAIATRWWHVFLIRFADRSAKGVRGAPRDVLLAESVERERIGSAFGLLQAMDSAGAIAGPLLALLLLRHFAANEHGYRAVFWTAAIPGLLSVAVVTMLARETRHESRAAVAEQASAPVPLGGVFYYVVAAVTLFSIGNSSDMFLILRAQEIGIGAVFAPLLGLVFNAVYTAASWPAGKLSDRLPRHTIAAAGYAVFGIVYLLFALAPSRSVVWAMMALYGLYYALTIPVLKALIADTVPPAARGRAFGIFYFLGSVAALLSSVATGALWQRYGAALPFTISAGLAFAASAMLLFAPRPRLAPRS